MDLDKEVDHWDVLLLPTGSIQMSSSAIALDSPDEHSAPLTAVSGDPDR